MVPDRHLAARRRKTVENASMVRRLSSISPFAMMGFEFAMAIAIALFLLSSATGNFLSLTSALAAVILSLGLQLINVLTEQMGGEVSVERGNGTRFRVAFGDAKRQEE